MNKDVIYIEPEDDITDILTGIKNSKSKIVALVPPKKANVLKSAVNFKLLARTAKNSEKAIVLVTSDSALLKLAAVAKIPVAKNLQTKPELVGDADSEPEAEDMESDIIDGEEAAVITKKDKDISKTNEDTAIESVDLTDEELAENTEKTDLDGKKTRKKDKKKKSAIPNFDKYRKFIIIGAAALVLLVGFLVWALAIAPKAKILVSVKTTSRQFSETVSFATEDSKADPNEGVFLLESHKITSKSSVEFEATGELDKGVKATGEITIARSGIVSSSSITVPKGTKFTINQKSYTTNADVTIPGTTNASDYTACSNFAYNCFKPGAVSADVEVTAVSAGTDYNIAAATSGWTPTTIGSSEITISSSAMAGGTTNIVKVVSAEDISKAKESLSSTSATEGKADLESEFPSGLMAISSSFKADSAEAISSPGLGEAVADGKTATLSVETTFSMYGVDRVRVAEYIETKTMVAISNEEDQKVYSTGIDEESGESKAFFESFRETDGKYTAKLKSTTKVGPRVTDEMVLEKSLGRKIGEVQSLLKSINGVSMVTVDTSFFWVTSVPDNINKVSVEITVE